MPTLAGRTTFAAMRRTAAIACGLAGLLAWTAVVPSADPPPHTDEKPASAPAPLKRELFRGKVVFLQDALRARGIRAFDEQKDQVALDSEDGRLIPLISDWRGRAFFQDERLRNRRVELVGTMTPGVPYLQVLIVYTFDERGRRQYTDYWCDICSIPMYEIKPCDCCQGDIRLRFQPQELPKFLDSIPADVPTAAPQR